ncbi:MAG: peptidase MA family metallohydrolase [Myxococcota bacterium]|nr:peptidase MA family metallohydrolase [Myxococcota bacterium]MEC9389435.1 peptidase MA family metallohydrolase [Myxococcota bacterium]
MIAAVIFLLGLIASPVHAAPSMSALPDSVELPQAEMPAVPEDWVVVPSPLADVYAAPRDRGTALRLSRHLAQRLPQLAAELDLPVGNRMHVVVAPTQQLFHDLQPGRLPNWADGTAWPHRGQIYLRAPRLRGNAADSLETVLEHEIVHVLLGRAFGKAPVPRWLQEGVAQLKSGEYSAETTATLARGILGDSLMSLYELSRGFPKNALRAQLAYAQSADFVAYIQNTHGDQAINTIIREMANGERFAPALRVATGETVDDLDLAWRARLQSSPLGLSPLFSEGVWWGLGAFLVPVAWFAVRRRNRKKLERWSREELLEDALYRTMERVFSEANPSESAPHDPTEYPYN